MSETVPVILLVEDNPDDEAMTLRALKLTNLAHDIVVVHDGVSALEYLHGENGSAGITPLPQVVLLDLKLPKLNGFEVLKRVREHPATTTLPVVILTSSDEDRDLAESYALGVNSYVRKPVDFREFATAVGSLGMYWLLVNKAPNRK
jgi:CheY-like chemotaxis protein